MKIKKKRTRILRSPRRWAAIFVVLLLAAIGTYAAFIHFHAEPTSRPAQTSTKPGVSGKKKPAEQKALYDVPATRPRELTIQKLGIDANVLPMGILKDGSLEAPKTAWDVGWYDQSALPGSGGNALLIDGHVNDALNAPGIFYKINSLRPGDMMQIQRGDDQLFAYHVVKVDQKPIEQVDMAGMLHSIEPGKEGLNLITCGGDYDYSRQTYNDRILVYAVRTD